MSENLGIVFPGQGSQKIGMLASIVKRYKEVRDILIQSSDFLGYNILSLIENGPEESLNSTVKTQPILLACSYALFKLVNLNPKVFAGHSLGEYTALLCANAIDLEGALHLVEFRGKIMQSACADGAMAAIIGLTNEQVETICIQNSNEKEIVEAANYNSEGQVVISGNKTAVLKAIDTAKDAGAKLAVSIPVSVPSHCSLMKDAANELKRILGSIEIKQPRVPIINNVNATIYKSSEEIKESLVKQLYKPVQWVNTIKNMENLGVTTLYECGPGKVLTSLNKRISKKIKSYTLDDLSLLETLEEKETSNAIA